MTQRPFSAAEQSTADRFREQLRPLAESIERESTAAAMSTRGLISRKKHVAACRARRKEARCELWAKVNQDHPMGLGVVEIWIMQWVISQLLNWIMREWLDVDQDDSDSD